MKVLVKSYGDDCISYSLFSDVTMICDSECFSFSLYLDDTLLGTFPKSHNYIIEISY